MLTPVVSHSTYKIPGMVPAGPLAVEVGGEHCRYDGLPAWLHVPSQYKSLRPKRRVGPIRTAVHPTLCNRVVAITRLASFP